MATPTYDLLDSVTLSSSASSVTFSSISQDYRDLIVVVNAKSAVAGNISFYLRLNGDSGSNYSYVDMRGEVISAYSNASAGETVARVFSTTQPSDTNAALGIAQIMDYSATDKHKSILGRADNAAQKTTAAASRWANTSAVTSVLVFTADSFASGSTFYLYGVAA